MKSKPPGLLRGCLFRRTLGQLALVIGVGSPVFGAVTTSAEAPREAVRDGFFASLLPESFQRNPRLDLNVVTEVMPEGRRISPPSADAPTYYGTIPGGYLQAGQARTGGEKAPPVADLERVMQKALAKANYLPARAEKPPTLAIVYHWGSHNNVAEEGQKVADRVALAAGSEAGPPAENSLASARDQLEFALANVEKRQDLIERAALVGGVKFAGQLAKALEDQIDYSRTFGPRAHVAPGGSPILGDAQARFVDLGSPFERFLSSHPQVEHLVEDSFSTCYFVIASAYDYAELTQGRRKLLWRTKMTVNGYGVALQDTLPTLVITAGQYFGREMPGAATVSRRLVREGQVETGAPIVIEYPTVQPPKKKSGR